MVTIDSPQSQIYNEIFKLSLSLGYETFDFLPANSVEYPFVYVGEQFDVDTANKSTITGVVTQRIHVYHDYTMRGELATMINKIKYELRELKSTDSFYIHIRGISSQLLQDNTTAQSLLHGIIEVELKFN